MHASAFFGAPPPPGGAPSGAGAGYPPRAPPHGQPQPQQPPQQQPQPPQFPVAQASFEVETSGTTRGGINLHDFLVECQLTRDEMTMQEMGVIEAAGVQDITEEELVGMGMKKLEVRRLPRSLAALTWRSSLTTEIME